MENISLLNEANPSYCTQVLAAGLLIEANPSCYTQVLVAGLLIEADPSYYTQVLGKNRKAWSINACLSPYNTTSVVSISFLLLCMFHDVCMICNVVFIVFRQVVGLTVGKK